MTDALSDLPLGKQLRDEGAKKVVDRLTADERRAVMKAILDQVDEFFPDDVREELSAGIQEKLDAFPNAMGGIFLQLAHADKIEQTGNFTHSARPERRHGVQFGWRVKR